MNRKQRIIAYIAAGLVTGLVLAAIALYTISRTGFGMERVRRLAVGWLDERVDGTVHVGSLGGRGLLGGVTLRDFYIIDKLGRPFLRTDSAILAYNWRTLLAGEIVITHATLFDAEIYLEQLPGDSIWNYQHVFPDRGEPGAPAQRRLIMINDLRVVNGTAVVRVPYETSAAARAAMADARRDVIDTVPGGLAKVLRFDSIHSVMPRVVWESPIEPGKLIDVRSLRGRGFIWESPMHVADLRGTVTLRDTVVSFDMTEVRFPASRATAVGRVIMQEGTNFFDVRVDSRTFAFRDLQWLYPRLPDEGGGNAVLRIQSQQPRGMLWLVTDARIVAPGTRLAGSFGVVTGADSLYFTNVDLRASPLNLELIQALLPNRLPIDGLLVGTVEVTGGLSALRTRGDVQLSSAGSQSGVKWRGTIDLDGGIGARNLRADLQKLDLALLAALRPDLNLRGQVTGRVDASGSVAGTVQFAADIEHYLAGYTSSFTGKGTYTGGKSPGLDVELNATPLSLEEIARHYPALERLQGEARGAIRLYGALDDLGVEADLQTLGGRAQLTGRLTRTGNTPRYSGEAKLFSFRLDRLVARLPETALDGTVSFDVSAGSATASDGRIDARLAQARVQGVELREALATLWLANHSIRVDTFAARTLLGELSARGSIGLDTTRSGRLAFELRTDSITPLDSDTLQSATTTGRVRGSGELTGSIQAFDLAATLGMSAFRLGNVSGDRVTATVRGTALGSADARIEVRGRADSLVAFRQQADTTTFAVTFAGGRGDAWVSAGSRRRNTYVIDTGFEKRAGGFLLSLRDLQVGQRDTPWRLAAATAIELDHHGITLDTVELRGENGGSAHAAGRIAWHDGSRTLEPASSSNFRLDFQGVPFSEVALVAAGSMNARGALDGHVRVSGTAVSPVIDGDAIVRGFGVGDATLDQLSGSFAYAGTQLNARVEGDKDGRRVLFADGLIPLNLAFTPVSRRRLDEPLRFSIQADSLPPTLFTAFVDGFSDVRGRLDGTLLATGTSAQPQLAGSIALRGARALWDVTGIRYHDVEGTLLLEQDRRARLDANLKTNGGTSRITGVIDFQRLSNPGFDLEMKAQNFLAARRRDADVTISGDIRLGGRYRQPELTGTIAVERGSLFLDELYRRYQIVDLDNPLLYDVVDTSLVAIATIVRTQNPFVKNLIVRDLRVAVGRETWLRSRDLNVEVAGELMVAFLVSEPLSGQRTADDLRLTGTLNALRGTYQLAAPGVARRFTIKEGTIEFPGTPGVDPNLGFNAVYRAPRSGGRDPIDIIAVVGGTLRTPRVRLTSDEATAVSESDLASYLFFGAPTYELSSSQNAVVGEALKSSGFGVLAGGLQNVAQSYGLLDYVALTPEAADRPGLQTSNGIASLFAGTRLELGRYLGDEGQVYVAYSQRLSSTGYRTPGVRVEWRLLPRLTGEIFWEDRFARNPDFGIEQSNLKRVWGLFLFREWTY